MFTLLLSAILGLTSLHEAGYTGAGTTIAIVDGGFYLADTVFPNAILADYDLYPADTAARYGTLYNDPTAIHGTCCLSTIVGRNGDWTGTAPDAQVYLIRTEVMASESRDEVDRLAEALYLADSLDADVVSISLGYFHFDDTTTNFSYADMDGKTTTAAIAAAEVGQRRIVCVAMGNEGANAWHYLITPADAENILSVGAVDSLGMPAPFSGYGPAADGRTKPEIAAWGYQTNLWKKGWIHGNGTSFATPEVAGMMACLRQALPDLSPAELRDYVIQSAQLSQTEGPQSDAAASLQIGYGVPDAELAYYLATGSIPTYSVSTISSEHTTARRYIRNGHIVIVVGNRTYNILGQ